MRTVGKGGCAGAAAALGGALGAGVVHEDVAHDAGGEAEEVEPVFPRTVLLPRELEVGLVDERRRVEGLGAALPEALAVRERAELAVDERQQPVECVAVSLVGEGEETGDLVGRGDRHGAAFLGVATG